MVWCKKQIYICYYIIFVVSFVPNITIYMESFEGEKFTVLTVLWIASKFLHKIFVRKGRNT